MQSAILEQLEQLEAHHQVKILYACESGSRAWGFASPDSDYDVRFIYVRPATDYLSIRTIKDVLELPVNELLDISGWDIRKALQLFLKSNAPLYEWLQSPIVYKASEEFKQSIQELMPTYFSLRAGCHHYLSMAHNTFEQDLQQEQVKLKKYFYTLRPLLAAKWIIDRRELPPMEFHLLRTIVDDAGWQNTIDALLERKKIAAEKETDHRVPLLNQWIQETLVDCDGQSRTLAAVTHDITELDKLFRKFIQHDL